MNDEQVRQPCDKIKKKPYECKKCKRKFTYWKRYKDHIDKAHDEKLRIPCEKCSKTHIFEYQARKCCERHYCEYEGCETKEALEGYKTKEALETHKKKVHEKKVERYACPWDGCGHD